MKNLAYIVLFIICTNTLGQDKANNYSELKLDTIFREHSGTFVLYELKEDTYKIYNSSHANQSFPVHSTSKILWSIIGLEEGLVRSESEIIEWDSIKYPPKQWWPEGFKQNQTIITALKYSVNWYYFELLKLMSPEMIEKYLNNLNYQRDYDVEKVHYFGLTFTIKKSAVEQVEFLKRIYLNDFNLSIKTLDIIKEGMLYKNTPSCKIYTRTGLGPLSNDNGIGWLIGWVEKENRTYIFAFNIQGNDEVEARMLRNEYPVRILKALDLFD
jgi:beta-lactamase class D